LVTLPSNLEHYQGKAREVKEMLLTMAQHCGIGERTRSTLRGPDERVTERLRAIATLEDLTEIRASIDKSAADLKTSIDRMTEEGKEVLDHLKKQVEDYQVKLEEAEKIASRDALTGVSSRVYVEGQIEKRIESPAAFCVAIVDIDGFKKVNDAHGHLTGDELLKQFAGELRSACRSTDVIGRWGGDEFILLFDSGLKRQRHRPSACANGSAATTPCRESTALSNYASMPPSAMRLLIAEDDKALGLFLSRGLEADGHRVRLAYDGQAPPWRHFARRCPI
jgi:GGDEF domain-containing protein